MFDLHGVMILICIVFMLSMHMLTHAEVVRLRKVNAELESMIETPRFEPLGTDANGEAPPAEGEARR